MVLNDIRSNQGVIVVRIGGSILLTALLVIALNAPQAWSQTTRWPALDSLDDKFRELDSLQISLNNAIQSDSTDISSWEGLVGLAKRRALYEQEMELAKTAVQILPRSSRAHTLLADAFLDNGYLPEAIESLHTALAHDSLSVRALTMLSEAFDIVDMSDSVMLYIDSAISLNPRYVQAHYQRADHLYRQGRRLESIESYEAWANLQPFKPEPWIRLGETQATVGLYSEALETLAYALQLSPDTPDALYLYATSLHGVGRTEEAKKAFVEFFFKFPRNKRAADAEEMARALGWTPGGG